MTTTDAATAGRDASVHRLLVRYMLVSLAAAIVTILLKGLAAAITGSVGLLSDAMESGVNLVAAIVALFALRTAARPPDAVHEFGHGKAEYLSAAFEGVLVFAAGTTIVWTAVDRLLAPAPLERAALGLALSTGASVVNLAVGVALVRAGRAHRSITLLADGKHLLTDVWTSGGVLVGIALVAVFGWEALDPIVALLVGVNVFRTGYSLVKRSITGLLDAALPTEDLATIQRVLDRYRGCEAVHIRAPRSREAGRQRFIYLNLALPGDWTVQQGHDLSERLEADIAHELAGATVFTQIETQEPVDPNRPNLGSHG
jgi:cation diffusion facilitator family transporter